MCCVPDHIGFRTTPARSDNHRESEVLHNCSWSRVRQSAVVSSLGGKAEGGDSDDERDEDDDDDDHVDGDDEGRRTVQRLKPTCRTLRILGNRTVSRRPSTRFRCNALPSQCSSPCSRFWQTRCRHNHPHPIARLLATTVRAH